MEKSESTLEVLFYLFENYSEVDDVSQNRNALQGYLSEAGFRPKHINLAFDWLESLADEDSDYIIEPHKNTFRVFSDYECRWINSDCRSYLMFLDEMHVLTPTMRERTIDRILELQDISFDLNKLKWVVLMLLLNQPNSEAAYTWMDSIALADKLPQYH